MAPRPSTLLKELEAMRVQMQLQACVVNAAAELCKAVESRDGARIARALELTRAALLPSRPSARTYSPAFRAWAASLGRRLGPLAAARQVGVSKRTLQAWMKNLTEGGGVVRGGSDTPSLLPSTSDSATLREKASQTRRNGPRRAHGWGPVGYPRDAAPTSL